jgi:hypothetical protein
VNDQARLKLNAHMGLMGGWLAGFTITDTGDGDGSVFVRAPGLDSGAQDMWQQVAANLNRRGWKTVIVYHGGVKVYDQEAPDADSI